VTYLLCVPAEEEPVVIFVVVLVLESRLFWSPVAEVTVGVDVVLGTLELIKSSCLLPKEQLKERVISITCVCIYLIIQIHKDRKHPKNSVPKYTTSSRTKSCIYNLLEFREFHHFGSVIILCPLPIPSNKIQRWSNLVFHISGVFQTACSRQASNNKNTLVCFYSEKIRHPTFLRECFYHWVRSLGSNPS
jgi:hypothetical protein